MMKRLCIFFFGTVLAAALHAQIRGNSVVVTVEPDHTDWQYKAGENVNYNVEVRKEGTLVDRKSVV